MGSGRAQSWQLPRLGRRTGGWTGGQTGGQAALHSQAKAQNGAAAPVTMETELNNEQPEKQHGCLAPRPHSHQALTPTHGSLCTHTHVCLHAWTYVHMCAHMHKSSRKEKEIEKQGKSKREAREQEQWLTFMTWIDVEMLFSRVLQSMLLTRAHEFSVPVLLSLDTNKPHTE